VKRKRKCAICHHLIAKHHEDELSTHIALVCDVEGCECIDGREQYRAERCADCRKES
jgi:hypothetical protein